MKHVRRHLALALALGLAGTACAADPEEAAPAGLRAAQEVVTEPTTGVAPQTTVVAEADVETTVVTPAEMAVAAAEDAVAEARAFCDDVGDQVSPLAGEDFANHVFTGPDLRCAVLTGADLRSAVIGPAATEVPSGDETARIDLSGADLSGADLSGARLSIVAVGADFSGADLRGADLLDSDLRGADFTGALLQGSQMTTLPDGLTLAVLSGATLGCNVLTVGPQVMLDGVVVDPDCGSEPEYFNRITLGGVLDRSVLSGFDFTDVRVEASSFRDADLTGVVLADHGVWPDGSDFTGADMSGADLSGTGFHRPVFDDAFLLGADLTETYWEDADAVGVILDEATMVGFEGVRGSYVGASLVGANLDGASIERADLTGADFTDTNRLDFLSTLVVCPSGVRSVDNVGRCDFDTPVSELDPAG